MSESIVQKFRSAVEFANEFKGLVVLVGPSGVGKGPLQKAIELLHPGMLKARAILCTSRPLRKGIEEDGSTFYFLPASLIKSLMGNPDFAVSRVRSDWQAIDLVQVEDLLSSNDLVFAEVHHSFGETLRAKASAKNVPLLTIFLTPAALDTPPASVIQIMRQKLDLRATDAIMKREERSNEAPAEMANAIHYSYVLLNPAGEDDVEEWGELGTRGGKPGGRPVKSLDDLGPAAKWLVLTFVDILRGAVSAGFHAAPSGQRPIV